MRNMKWLWITVLLIPLTTIGCFRVHIIGSPIIGSPRTRAQSSRESKSPFTSLAMFRDGSRVVAGIGLGEVCIWALPAGTLLNHFKLTDCGLMSLSVSPTGDHILSTTSYDGGIALWTVDDGYAWRTLPGPTSCYQAMALSPKGDYIVCGLDDGRVQMWNTSDSVLVRTFLGNHVRIFQVIVSADGRHVIASTERGIVYVWKLHNGKLIYQWDTQEARPTGIVEFPGSGEIVSVTQAQLRISGGTTHKLNSRPQTRLAHWNLKTGDLVCSQTIEEGNVWSVAAMERKRQLLLGKGDGTCVIWSIADGREIRRLRASDPSLMSWCFAVATPDERYIVTITGSGNACVFDAQTGEMLKDLPLEPDIDE